MQLSNYKRKENGRRYTPLMKSLSLAIYKQGPKCYRFLQRVFALPVKNTLAKHSAYLLLKPGIDGKLMQLIENKVASFTEIDKYCMLVWDEVSLRPHLQFSPSRDTIDGFVDMELRHPRFATHSLTFMVRGINTRYKQPTAHYYNDSISAADLNKVIVQVTEAVFNTGISYNLKQIVISLNFFRSYCFYALLIDNIRLQIKKIIFRTLLFQF